MIYGLNGEYTISAYGVWLPGVYDSQRAARYAFRFDYNTLKRVRDSIGKGQLITFDLLRETRNKTAAT